MWVTSITVRHELQQEELYTMNTPTAKFRRAKDEKFLIVDELVFDNLSPYALKVYGQLRKLTSYTTQDDETEITVKNLAKAAGISERKTYDCLNELEHVHYIIQRINIYHIRWGQINTFNVSQTYERYKPVEAKAPTAPKTAPVDNYGQSLPTTAPRAVPPAQYAVPTAPNADLIKKQDLSQEVSKKKQNKNPVFSDTESVKTHLNLVTAKRQTFLEDETIEQGIYYAYETNTDKSFDSVNKKLNIFLKKVREGKWLIPQGWNEISSQSIREKEESEQRAKQEQYKQDAQMFQGITGAVAKGEGLKSFSAMFQKLKDDLNGKDVYGGGMQKQAV